MNKLIFITFLTFALFVIEYFLFNMVGHWLMPDLLLLLVIFLGLYFGIRHSLFSAVLAGILKDSFSINPFGVNVVAFMTCAFMVTVFSKYLYRRGSQTSRIFLVFYVVVINTIVRYFCHKMFGPIDFGQVLKFIFVPQALATLILATYVFNQLKQCVTKLSA